MNFGITSKVLVFTFFVSLFSCSNKPKRPRNPVSHIKIENKHDRLVSGEDLLLSFSIKADEGELKQAVVSIDNEVITTTKELNFNYKVEKFAQVGKHTVKIVATKNDGSEGTNYREFEVYSDIIPENYTYKVVASYPHNTKHFTEGFEIHNGFLYESTGENGTSGIFKKNLKTGQVIQSVPLEEKYFGEGITIFNDKIYQLTYKDQKGFIYDLKNMSQTGNFNFESQEGWGMTHDNQYLIMGDGTNVLTYLNPADQSFAKRLQVYDNKGAVNLINELEYVDGYIYANIYTEDRIIKIDAKTGKVLQDIDMKAILGSYTTAEKLDVLNGIAIDAQTGKIYVTGKFWPKVFEVQFIKKG